MGGCGWEGGGAQEQAPRNSLVFSEFFLGNNSHTCLIHGTLYHFCFGMFDINASVWVFFFFWRGGVVQVNIACAGVHS